MAASVSSARVVGSSRSAREGRWVFHGIPAACNRLVIAKRNASDKIRRNNHQIHSPECPLCRSVT